MKSPTLLSEAVEKVRDKPYKYGEWDCLHLAKYLCDSIQGEGIFPDILTKYSNVNESESGEVIANDITTYCTKVDSLVDGCIVLLTIKNHCVLSSYYSGYVVYMGEFVRQIDVPRVLFFNPQSFVIKSNSSSNLNLPSRSSITSPGSKDSNIEPTHLSACS